VRPAEVDCNPTETDEHLLAAYRASGCRKALDTLVRRHLRAIRALMLPMVLDDAAADDLTQEVFLRAFRGLDGFRGKSRFSTWLYRVAMNTAYGFLNRRGKGRVEFRAELPDRVEREAAGPEKDALGAELAAEVTAALGTLSPKLRAAVALVGMQQMGVRQAAKVEGCTLATMYWRLHQARRLLKRRLERYASS